MDKLKEYLNKVLQVVKGLSRTQQIIIGVAVVVVIGAIVMTTTFSAKPAGSYLFNRPLSIEEYGKITKALEGMGAKFTTKGDQYIIVDDEEAGRSLRMKLAQEDVLPEGIKGWELFDMESWTTTQFDRDIKLRRALEGEIKKHLEALDWIEDVSISVAKPERSIYMDKDQEVSASITITPAPGHLEELDNKKLIKGVENIILHGIDGLVRDKITVTDNKGRILNDFSGEELENKYKYAREERKIIDREREKIEKTVRESLRGIISDDRYKVSVGLEIGFDTQSYEQKDVLPIVIKPRTPGLAYDDSIVKETLKVSDKHVKEDFKGQSFIPEGPPGQEPNIPPGYKENIDRWNVYSKEENINNYLNGEKNMRFTADQHDIKKITVAVEVDGVWKKTRDERGGLMWTNGSLQRMYEPYPDEDLRKLDDCIKGSIAYDQGRGDLVVVRTVPFDRRAEHLAEDEAWLKQQQMRRILMITLFSLLGILVLSVVYRLIKKEILRRRRLRERELARQRQLQRDDALRALESDTPLETMSEADRARLDLLERAEQIAAERPGDVAKLLRTWIQED